jgi:hypothetical protein
MDLSNLSPDSKLTRVQLAEALTNAGFPTSPATLATKATRGGGPPYQYWGPKPIYTWAPSLEWAERRLSALVESTSAAGTRRPSGRGRKKVVVANVVVGVAG